jgi:hypothetical protein
VHERQGKYRLGETREKRDAGERRTNKHSKEETVSSLPLRRDKQRVLVMPRSGFILKLILKPTVGKRRGEVVEGKIEVPNKREVATEKGESQ